MSKPGKKSSARRRAKAKAKGSSRDASPAVDAFVQELPPPQRALAEQLRELVFHTVPGAGESIKWKMPVFEHHGLLCYIAAHKGHLRFGFYQQGTRLNDPDGLLEGSGKSMRHVKIREPSDIKPIFGDWLREAAAINES